MLKIAICDDNPQERQHTHALLEAYCSQKLIHAKIDLFHSAMDLLDTLHRENYQILLLDILMPGVSGIQAAREIRAFDPETRILFLTSAPDFAVESYRLNAFYYLMKPVRSQELFPVLDRLLAQLCPQEETVLLTLPTGLLRLPCSSIEVLEVNNRQLLFCLKDGTVRQAHGTLTEYEPKLLNTGAFVKVHRSYLVNMNHIMHLQNNELTTYSGKIVPVSRLLSNRIRGDYMDFLFQKEGIKK